MLLCFVIVFGSVSKPVKAIAGLDDAVYFVLGSFCLSLAVDIAVDNPATGEELLRLWNALSDGSQRAVQAAANGIVWYGNTVYDWEVETWTSVANEIKTWFDNNHSSGSDFGVVIPNNSDGYIGFTQDTLFTMYYPNYTSGTQSSSVFILPNSVFFAYNRFAIGNCPFYGSYYCDADYYTNPDGLVCYTSLKSSSGLAFVQCSFSVDGADLSGVTFTPYLDDRHNPPYNFCFSSNGYFDTSFFTQSSRSYGYAVFYYDYNSGLSYTIDVVNSKWAFVNPVNGAVFQNLSFNTAADMVNWFLGDCGFVTPSISIDDTDPYTAPANDTGITYDSDATQNAIDNIGDHVIDDSLPMVIPGSDANLQDLADNPSAVWDIGATGVYSGDVDLPSVPGSVWSDKFPFCIPFDIVRLFTSFFEEAEAPHFHFCVIPENSFGLQNEAIYWDIDFADYDILVKILRVFIALAFTLWLIMITRKVIGA